jgi:hypothetical protein
MCVDQVYAVIAQGSDTIADYPTRRRRLSKQRRSLTLEDGIDPPNPPFDPDSGVHP